MLNMLIRCSLYLDAISMSFYVLRISTGAFNRYVEYLLLRIKIRSINALGG